MNSIIICLVFVVTIDISLVTCQKATPTTGPAAINTSKPLNATATPVNATASGNATHHCSRKHVDNCLRGVVLGKTIEEQCRSVYPAKMCLKNVQELCDDDLVKKEIHENVMDVLTDKMQICMNHRPQNVTAAPPTNNSSWTPGWNRSTTGKPWMGGNQNATSGPCRSREQVCTMGQVRMCMNKIPSHLNFEYQCKYAQVAMVCLKGVAMVCNDHNLVSGEMPMLDMKIQECRMKGHRTGPMEGSYGGDGTYRGRSSAPNGIQASAMTVFGVIAMMALFNKC